MLSNFPTHNGPTRERLEHKQRMLIKRNLLIPFKLYVNDIDRKQHAFDHFERAKKLKEVAETEQDRRNIALACAA